MNNCLITSIEYITATLPGTMICDAVEVRPFNIEIAFLIKETQLHFNELIKGNSDIDMRSGLMRFDNVVLTPLLIQVNNNPSMTYQIWFNYHESEYVKQYFDYLATQEILYLLFFTNDYAQVITVNNSLQLGFKLHLHQLKNKIPWSIADFEHAKSKLLNRYPTTISLWNGLKKTPKGDLFIKEEANLGRTSKQ